MHHPTPKPHTQKHNMRGQTAMVTTVSMIASMIALEKIHSPGARIFAVALIAAVGAASRELLWQERVQGRGGVRER